MSVVSRCRQLVGDGLVHSCFIVRCPLTFVASFWLCLPASSPAAACLGFEQSMYIQVHTQHVYVQPICCSSVKYCTCHRAAKKLFSSSFVQLFLRSTVPPFNCPTAQLSSCATVQLFNCPTCRALSGMEEQELRLPLLSRRRQRLNCFTCFTGITCIFRSISSLSSRGTQTCHIQTDGERGRQNECGISLFARLAGKYFALILAHQEKHAKTKEKTNK